MDNVIAVAGHNKSYYIFMIHETGFVHVPINTICFSYLSMLQSKMWLQLLSNNFSNLYSFQNVYNLLAVAGILSTLPC